MAKIFLRNYQQEAVAKFLLKWAKLIESGECSNDSGHGTFKKGQIDTDYNPKFTIEFIESEDE